MGKYKICVYAIAKNESKFVKRWVDSMQEADAIYVLDTGSTDDTAQKLKDLGVNVKTEKITPWRFDKARNKSLELVPKDTDICVCTDLDEVLQNGWREELEKMWTTNANRMRYTYNWRLDSNNNPLVTFLTDKIHSRNDYIWTHPVHEILTFKGEKENVLTAEKIVLNHYPDLKKSRSSYLPLLELSVKEDPDDDRNTHYLGREYMYYGKWEKCIETLKKHLSLPSATWKDERCASMRFISRAYINLNQIDNARLWLDKAINEAPYLRDPYVERALLEYKEENWDDVLYYCTQALKIRTHQMTYINEVFSWDHTIYDLLSLYFFNIKEYDVSLFFVNKALKITPNEERLINNKKFIENFV